MTYFQILPNYKFINQLKNLPFVEKIYLFGSRARGDANDTSDIDLAIVCPEASKTADWLKIVDIIDEADTLLKIDIVRLDQVDEIFKNKIYRQGILIYERKNSTEAR